MRSSASLKLAALVAFMGAGATTAQGTITLEFRPTSQAVFAGQDFEIGLYAVADPAEVFGLVDVVLGWDPARVTLLGNDTTGAHPWGESGFPTGGLNPGPGNLDAWDDGTAFYRAVVDGSCNQGTADSVGLLVTTFRFNATSGTGATVASILASSGGFNTAVFEGNGLAGCPNTQLNHAIGASSSANVIACSSNGDCADGDSCTDDVCNASNVCTNNANYNEATECCNPATGDVQPISDNNDCTDDVCNADGSVQHINSSVGKPCGSGADNVCTDPDTCDGAGSCLPNNAADGVVCNDSNVCTTASACQSGVCTGTAFEAQGTSCNDGLDCTQTDECDGAGACTGSGNPCAGNPVNFFCSEADDPGPPPLPYTCVACEDDDDCPDFGCMSGSCSPLTQECGFTIGKLCTDTLLPCGQSSECPDGECVDGCEAIDGSFCNGQSSCDSLSGTCQPDPNPDPCPGQFCSETLGCIDCQTPNDCDQSNQCTPEDCVDGFCQQTSPPDCTFLNTSCAIGVCDPMDGQCDSVPVEDVSCTQASDCGSGYICVADACAPAEPCDDGDICTPTDVCENGLCVALDSTVPGVDLYWAPAAQSSPVGEIVLVDLFASSSDGQSHSINTIEAVMVWPAENLVLLGNTDPCEAEPCPSGQYDWQASFFAGGAADPDGINTSFEDGDAWYQAQRRLGGEGAPVDPGQDLWVTRFQFLTIGPTPQGQPADLTLSPCYGQNPTFTRVQGDGPGRVITDNLGSATIGVSCRDDNDCDDQDCCTADTCLGGTCQFEAIPGCTPCQSNAECDDGLSCTDDVCEADGCCQNNDICVDDGVFCNGVEYCDAGLDACTSSGNPCPGAVPACNEVDGCPCTTPLVEEGAGRYLIVTPLPEDSVTPIKLLVTSPDLPCLSKYVGNFARCNGTGAVCNNTAICGGAPCELEASLALIDIDGDTIDDGVVATLVDDPADALLLTPSEWVGDITGGRLYVTGQDIIPSNRLSPTAPIDPTVYEIQADCGGLTDPASVEMYVWGDVDSNAVVNFTDIQLGVNAFQGIYGLGDLEPNSLINCDIVNTANPCEPEQINNFVDISATVRAFQGQQYDEYVQQFALPDQDCTLPCP